MTIKVKDASQREAVPASAAQIAEIQADLSIATPTAVQTLIEANDNLGALATPVQTLVNTGVSTAQARSGHTGFDPASNVLFADGTTLEQFKTIVTTFMGGASPTAPSLSTDPTIATTTGSDGAVGSIMTATTGTVVGTATQTLWQWNRVNATTASTPILGATSATYTRSSADFNQGGTPYRLTVTETVIGSTGLAGNPRTSAQSSATTATAPANTVAPSMSGSTAQGTQLTYDDGTWTGSPTSYGIQLYDNGVPFGPRTTVTATTGNLISTASIAVGHVITMDFIGYSALGVPSAVVASSNSITVTGVAPAVSNTAVPIWANPLQFGVANSFTQGSWSGTINAARTWEFYRNAETTPYVTPANTLAIHTPRSPAVVGDTLYIVETVTETATGLTYSARSAGVVIAATPVTFAVTQAQTGLTWTAGAAISSVTPITATGGTTPYTFSIVTTSTPALPTGLSLNPSTGAITGTPSASVALATYTIRVTDAVGATATQTFTATVNSAGVTPTPTLPLNMTIAFNPRSELPSSYTDGNTLTGSDGIVRLQKVADPGGSGQQVYLHRVVRTDCVTGGGTATTVTSRAEKLWIDISGKYMFPGNSGYWAAFGVRPKSGEWPTASGNGGSDEAFTIFQTHSESTGDTQPPIQLNMDVGLNLLKWRSSYSAASQATSPQANFTDYTSALPTVDVWRKYVVFLKPGYTTGQGPQFKVWEQIGSGSWTQIVNVTHLIDYNWNTGSYWRTGIYCYSGSNWSTGLATRAAYYTTVYEASDGATGGSFEACVAALGNL